jgi:TPR repeat protein
MGMRFTFLAWIFFGSVLTLSAGATKELAPLLKAAEAGDAEAQFTLASTLYHGGSAEQAVGWLKKAAERKHPKAWRLLGDFHAKGLVAKGKVDAREAANCYQKAAALGDAAAMGKLAECYFEGRGVARSTFTGVKWLRSAAQAGDRGAARLLAMRLAEGDDIARDPAEAYLWLIVGTEGFGQGLWEVKLAEYRAKVPASQRKAAEEAAQKIVRAAPARR